MRRFLLSSKQLAVRINSGSSDFNRLKLRKRSDYTPTLISSSVRYFSNKPEKEEEPFNLFTPSDEHANLREMVRSWAAEYVEPQATEYNRKEEFNYTLFKRLGEELGLLGPLVSEEYGGAGMEDVVTACIIHEELSYVDPAFCLSYLAHSMLFVHNLYHNGNHEQKIKYLPAAISGEKIGGMCMSEPGCGTDVLGLQTKAISSACGKGYSITGRKMWITNGAISSTESGDLFLVYANTSQVSDPNAKWDRKNISLFLVEKEYKGFALGQKIHDKCGMRASATAELVFDDVFVPKENLIGELGKGALPMMRNLEIERIVLAAMSCGIARRAIDQMRRYASDRQSFGKSLDQFGQIQAHIATSYAEWQASRSYLYMCARTCNLQSSGQRIDSDGVKLVATKMATKVCDRAIQVHGGYGYCGEYVVERLWRDAKLLEIGGGTLEAHQKNIVNDLAREVGPAPMAN